MHDIENVDEQRGMRGLMSRQRVEQVARPRHHKREDQSIGFGKRECTLDCSMASPSIAELDVRPRGDEMSFD